MASRVLLQKDSLFYRCRICSCIDPVLSKGSSHGERRNNVWDTILAFGPETRPLEFTFLIP